MMQDDARALLAALDTDDWSAVREAVEQVGDVLRTQQVDDALRAGLASRLLHLSSHPKWEVRKAVAHAVLFLRHDAFPAVIARIVDDDNAWVREAARKTLQRREGLSRGDIHGQAQGDAIDGLLAAVETRHGARARRAAMNVADHRRQCRDCATPCARPSTLHSDLHRRGRRSSRRLSRSATTGSISPVQSATSPPCPVISQISPAECRVCARSCSPKASAPRPG